VIRAFGLAAFGAAIYVLLEVAPGCNGTPTNACPGYSFNNALVLRSERAAVVLGVLLAVLTLFVRVVVVGTVPDQVGQTGLGWSDNPKAIRKASVSIKELRKSVSGVRSESEERTKQAASEAAELIANLDARVTQLEQRESSAPPEGDVQPTDTEDMIQP
jgi:Sec-independent protein translocase protein TatA